MPPAPHQPTHCRVDLSCPPPKFMSKHLEATDRNRSIMVLTITLTPLLFKHEDIRQPCDGLFSHVYTHTVPGAAVRPTPIIPVDGGDVCSDICFSQCGPVIAGLSGAIFRVNTNSNGKSYSTVLNIMCAAFVSATLVKSGRDVRVMVS